METTQTQGRAVDGLGLETFLGGMETGALRLVEEQGKPLKPSLVEWKLPRTRSIRIA